MLSLMVRVAAWQATTGGAPSPMEFDTVVVDMASARNSGSS
jgi:hypothetical protein